MRISKSMSSKAVNNAAIIGAGPAGLMAAEVLARHGVAVTLYERMANPARKFLMAGRGGLNITHSENRELLLTRYGPERDRLEPAIRAFPPEAVRAWCAELGEETFVGSSGRVFPKSFKASPLLRAWLKRLAAYGVELKTRHDWRGFGRDGAMLFDTPQGPAEARCDAVLFALGGASWPRLGADGSWVAHFAARGIAVAPLAPANCGFTIDWTPEFAARFAGHPLKPVRFSHGGESLQGEAMIAAAGIEGGAVYALSRALRETIARDGQATLTLDLMPHNTADAIAVRLARPKGKQSLSNHLRRAGLDALRIHLLRDATQNNLPAAPDALAALIKALPLRLTGTAGLARAISTAGGVCWEDIDDHLMLRALPGCFVAGEMLDWEAPTGGYLLQACLATGAKAAQGMLNYLEVR